MLYISPMRLAPVFAFLLATPLHAWEFSATPICALTHVTHETTVRVTYDPRVPEYAIALTRTDATWPDAPVFALRFDGPRGLTISTTRHRLSDGGTTLTVTDTGFGNVLDGFESNDTATALIGAAQVAVPLSGAATAVRAFRACTDAGFAWHAGSQVWLEGGQRASRLHERSFYDGPSARNQRIF